MCYAARCRIEAGFFLAVFSLALPTLLLIAIGLSRRLRGREWALGAMLVVIAGPMSFFLTAYFFLGLPLVLILSLVASVVSRGQMSARVMLLAPVVLYALWWIVAGAWALDCPNCGDGAEPRTYVWGVSGLMLASPLAALLLTLEFGRVVFGRILWRTPAQAVW